LMFLNIWLKQNLFHCCYKLKY